jgi:hypothetical protein
MWIILSNFLIFIGQCVDSSQSSLFTVLRDNSVHKKVFMVPNIDSSQCLQFTVLIVFIKVDSVHG